MIKPSVGRVVHFYEYADIKAAGDQPMAATVTFVHADRKVNLVVFTHEGNPRPYQNVVLLQDADEPPANDLPFAEWMEYQRGQAAKYDALVGASS